MMGQILAILLAIGGIYFTSYLLRIFVEKPPGLSQAELERWRYDRVSRIIAFVVLGIVMIVAATIIYSR